MRRTTPDATHISVTAEYCPAVFVFDAFEARVTPDAVNVTCPVPSCSTSTRSPTAKILGTVIVIADPVERISVNLSVASIV
jgi:hypothetical protein